MKLITADIKKKIEKHPIRSQDGKGIMARVLFKLFCPWGRMTLFVTEGEWLPEENTYLLYGYMVSPLGADCDEWGEVLLSELESVRGPAGLKIERDMHFPEVVTVGEALRGMGL